MNTLIIKFVPLISVIQYGYFIYGILFMGWSATVLLMGFWIESLVDFSIYAALLLFAKGGKLECASFVFKRGFAFLCHTIFFLLVDIRYGSSSVSLGLLGSFLLENPEVKYLQIKIIATNILLFTVIRYSSNILLYFANNKWRMPAASELIKTAYRSVVPLHLILMISVLGIYQGSDILLVAIVVIRFLIDILIPLRTKYLKASPSV